MDSVAMQFKGRHKHHSPFDKHRLDFHTVELWLLALLLTVVLGSTVALIIYLQLGYA